VPTKQHFCASHNSLEEPEGGAQSHIIFAQQESNRVDSEELIKSNQGFSGASGAQKSGGEDLAPKEPT